MLDTLKLVRRLQDGGMAREQAEALSTSLAEGLGEQVATKTDLELVETRLSGKIEQLRIMIGITIAGILAVLVRSFFA